jgi:hypothetical protein
MNAPGPKPMAAPDAAVQDYLDALLSDAPGHDYDESVGESPQDEAGGKRYRICRIASVRLALPADELIEPLPLPSLLAYAGNHWLLGRHRHAGREWQVVDLARIVAPGVPRPLPDHLLPLRRGHWALACTLEDETIQLADDAIRWRDARSNRPWLAGMTQENACAVVDLDALLAELATDPVAAAEE